MTQSTHEAIADIISDIWPVFDDNGNAWIDGQDADDAAEAILALLRAPAPEDRGKATVVATTRKLAARMGAEFVEHVPAPDGVVERVMSSRRPFGLAHILVEPGEMVVKEADIIALIALAEGRAGETQGDWPSEAAVERAAEAIFNHYMFNKKAVAWIAGGNSLKQDEARCYARRALATTAPHRADGWNATVTTCPIDGLPCATSQACESQRLCVRCASPPVQEGGKPILTDDRTSLRPWYYHPTDEDNGDICTDDQTRPVAESVSPADAELIIASVNVSPAAVDALVKENTLFRKALEDIQTMSLRNATFKTSVIMQGIAITALAAALQALTGKDKP